VRLVIALPHLIHLDLEVAKVTAEGIHGSFTMLPHHLDYVVLLQSGILSYTPTGQTEQYVAVDGGVLAKVGDEVRVSTLAAVSGDRLDELERTVVEAFAELGEREQTSRAALTRIESHLLQQFFEFEEPR
jgi:alternate F1F0 ATPase F1 subunit epsilon